MDIIIIHPASGKRTSLPLPTDNAIANARHCSMRLAMHDFMMHPNDHGAERHTEHA